LCTTDLTEGSTVRYDIPGIVLTETISDDLMPGLGVNTGGTTVPGKEGEVYIEMTSALLPGTIVTGMEEVI
jgi:hypothetical protein